MSEPVTLSVGVSGSLTFIWDDSLGPGLVSLGRPAIRRASHVEPTADGRWMADLSPVGGPTLGPFEQRQQALAAERAWLEQNTQQWT